MDEKVKARRLKILISNLIRVIKFSAVGITTFGIEESVIGLGYTFLGPQYLIPVNAVSIVSSVTVSFLLNENWTVRHEGFHGGEFVGLLWRWLKFQGVYLAGSLVGLLVQLSIYHKYGLHPIFANMVGALAGYPLNYFSTMIFVWKIKIWKPPKYDNQVNNVEELFKRN